MRINPILGKVHPNSHFIGDELLKEILKPILDFVRHFLGMRIGQVQVPIAIDSIKGILNDKNRLLRSKSLTPNPFGPMRLGNG
jgi:hypothetical protein